MENFVVKIDVEYIIEEVEDWNDAKLQAIKRLIEQDHFVVEE